MRTLAILAVSFSAALVGLTSCKKEVSTDPVDPTQTKDVVISLQSGSPTRVIEDPIAAAQTITLNNGLIFFLNAAGTVISVEDIDPDQIQSLSGQTFPDVSSMATDVYVVGNYPAATAFETNLRNARALSQIKTLGADINSYQGKTSEVMIANALDQIGHAAYDGKIKLNGDVYEAKVLLVPAVARIQIADIKSSDPKIKSFKFAGIYVDNFYQYLSPVNPKSGSGSLLTIGTNPALLGTLGANMYDQPTTPVQDDALTVTAGMTNGSGTSKVWGYLLGTTGTTGSDIPRLIIKLENVMVDNGSGGSLDIGTKYVTITGFTRRSAPVTSLDPGKIYNIPSGDFDFAVENLADSPNASKIDIVVNVIVLPWTLTDIGVVM